MSVDETELLPPVPGTTSEKMSKEKHVRRCSAIFLVQPYSSHSNANTTVLQFCTRHALAVGERASVSQVASCMATWQEATSTACGRSGFYLWWLCLLEKEQNAPP